MLYGKRQSLKIRVDDGMRSLIKCNDKHACMHFFPGRSCRFVFQVLSQRFVHISAKYIFLYCLMTCFEDKKKFWILNLNLRLRTAEWSSTSHDRSQWAYLCIQHLHDGLVTLVFLRARYGLYRHTWSSPVSRENLINETSWHYPTGYPKPPFHATFSLAIWLFHFINYGDARIQRLLYPALYKSKNITMCKLHVLNLDVYYIG